jgi:hypothetical protein
MLERSPRVTRMAEGSRGVTDADPESPQSHVWRGFRRDSMVTRRPESANKNRRISPKRGGRMSRGGVGVRKGLHGVSIPPLLLSGKHSAGRTEAHRRRSRPRRCQRFLSALPFRCCSSTIQHLIRSRDQPCAAMRLAVAKGRRRDCVAGEHPYSEHRANGQFASMVPTAAIGQTSLRRLLAE